jgi:PLP dependent protein
MLIAPQNSAAALTLAENLLSLRREISAAAATAHRSERSVTLVAVSKGQEASTLRAAAALGIRDFGESYLQEALAKHALLTDLPLTWHFIGRVQSNKTRPLAEQFDWVHGIERLKIAERLSAQRPPGLAALNVCLQINIAAEPRKAGIAPAAAAPLAAAVARLPRLRLRGLMCILPAGLAAADARRAFGALRALLEQLNAAGAALDTLSMGMSADFREAIVEGATLVRVGTALFGARELRAGGEKAGRDDGRAAASRDADDGGAEDPRSAEDPLPDARLR